MATRNLQSTETMPETPPYPEGTTEADWAQLAIEAIGLYKDDPEFVKRLFEDAAEARRAINAEYLRELDESDKK